MMGRREPLVPVRCRAGKAAALVFQGAWLVETAKIMMDGESCSHACGLYESHIRHPGEQK